MCKFCSNKIDIIIIKLRLISSKECQNFNVITSLKLEYLHFQLLFEDEFSRIEKIKVISSTYMAACGLQSGRKNSLEFSPSSGSNGIDPIPSSATSAMSDPSLEPFSHGENAILMARFAAAMMRTVKISSTNYYGFNFHMRIGKKSTD